MEHPIKIIAGIGSITGPLIAAELGDLRASKAGVRSMPSWPTPAWTPEVRKSGQWRGKIKMSKRGSAALRTALYQAASMARLQSRALPKSITATVSK